MDPAPAAAVDLPKSDRLLNLLGRAAMLTSLGKTCLLVAFASSVTACSTNKVRVDSARDTPIACKSFDWLRAGSGVESFTEQRVREAALRELTRKGYQQSSEQPDCKVSFDFAAHESSGGKPRVGVGVGGGSGGLGGGVGISLPIPGGKRRSGEFSLNVIDAKKNAEIWRGSTEAATRDAELTAGEAAELVEKVLAKFPSRANAS